jgi:hypothetical protein
VSSTYSVQVRIQIGRVQSVHLNIRQWQILIQRSGQPVRWKGTVGLPLTPSSPSLTPPRN